MEGIRRRGDIYIAGSGSIEKAWKLSEGGVVTEEAVEGVTKDTFVTSPAREGSGKREEGLLGLA